MIKVGVSQRVVNLSQIQENRDELDQRWFPFLKQCGILPIVLPNSIDNISEYVEATGIEGFILTGGNNFSGEVLDKIPNLNFIFEEKNDQSPLRDIFETELIKYSILKKQPLLGVCRGMQLLNLHSGGNLRPVVNHTAVRHEIIDNEKNKRNVNSFHDFGMITEDISPDYEIVYKSADGVVESINHKKENIQGIMWHPEREEISDIQDVRYFQEFFKKDKK